MTTQSKPTISFTGTDSEWQLIRLGDYGRTVSGVGFPEQLQGGQNGVPFYKVSDMNTPGNESTLTTAANYVTSDQIAQMQWHAVQGTAVFFAKVGAAVMKNRKRIVLPPFLLDNNTMAYVYNENSWIPSFILRRFDQIDLVKLVQVGALPSYNATQVEDIQTWIPADLEQQRSIGDFFSCLDDLLDASAKKIEKLKQLKSTMLTKMFPQGNSRVPEIRFEGFQDEWKEYTFRSLFGFGTSIPVTRANLNDKMGDGLSVHYGDILTSLPSLVDSKSHKLPFISDPELVSKSFGKRLLDGDLVMADTAEDESVGRCVELCIKGDLPVFGGLHTYVLRSSEACAKGFLSVLMNSELVHSQIVRFSQGTKVTSISKEALSGVLLLVPSISEQESISHYFRELDTLISSETEMLEKLRHLKSAFLKSMFV